MAFRRPIGDAVHRGGSALIVATCFALAGCDGGIAPGGDGGPDAWRPPAALDSGPELLDTRSDMDGDGLSDLVFQNQTSGRIVVWPMDGLVRKSVGGGFTFPMSPDVGIDDRLATVADLHGDADRDLVFQNVWTGNVSVWVMDGTTRAGLEAASPPAPVDVDPLAWSLRTSGDFNQDGQGDLVFQNVATGAISVWLMEPDAAVPTRAANTLTNPAAPQAGARARLATSGDFDGDGRSDLVFQDAESGAVSVWLMDGTTRIAERVTDPDAPVDRASWRVATAGDFDADGQSDLVFQNVTSARIVVWLMNGVMRTTGDFTTPDRVEGNWRVSGG